MKHVLIILALFSISTLWLSGCASSEEDPGKKYRPVIFQPAETKTQEKLPEEITVRFRGTVTKIKKVPANQTPSGLVVGSKYHVKQEVVVHVDDIMEDKLAFLRPGRETSFSVERLSRVFGDAIPELAADESQRQYRFVMKGELNYKNEYDWVYLRGTRVSF